jgi:thioredoxin-related protein
VRSEPKVRLARLLWGVFLVAGALAAPVRAQQGPALPSIDWSDLESAVKTARTTNKPVFVNVYADWCGYCRKMDQTTFRDAGVVSRLNTQFVPARLNGESSKKVSLGKGTMTESEWAMRQGVEGFPALVVLDPKGRTLLLYPGFLEASQASMILGDVSAFLKAGGIDKRGNFLDWAEKRQKDCGKTGTC